MRAFSRETEKDKTFETPRSRAATKKKHLTTEARRKARINSKKIKVKTSTQRTRRNFRGCGELNARSKILREFVWG